LSCRVVATLRAAGCVFAEDEARLLIDAATPAELDDMVARRVSGVPLEHVLGWAEFRGLRVAVDPGVFVPRRRTEHLAVMATRLAGPSSVVVDLCCGSGAVGMAVVTAIPAVDLHAADLDPAAVRCARRNLDGIGTVHEGDLDAPLPTELLGRVEVLIANTPYVPTDKIATMPPEARDHEPRLALDGGTDGLDIQRRVAAVAPKWLASGGHLLIETSERQAPLLVETMAHNSLRARIDSDDDLGATIVIGQLPLVQP
jgi:release factor glutamine methyltransferase